ncbi:MAG: MFS transporter [Rhodospirillaceae bacterium]|nr:MFS transporter [Rhodospirillaceae bacterium]
MERTLSARERRLSLSVVIAGVFGVGIAFGALVPLVGLLLDRRGIGATWIGLNAAMFPIATIMVGPVLPRLVARLGTLRSMYLGLGLSAAFSALFPVLPEVWAWFVLRYLIGVAAGMHWVVSETWINSIATDRDRGLVMGIYATVLAAGFALGPSMLNLTGIDGAPPFMVVAVALLLSAAPLALAAEVAPAMPARPERGLRPLIAVAPAVMVAAVVGGFVDSALFALLPVYGLALGLDQTDAVLLLTAFIGGNVLLQVPLGWIADRTSRRGVLLACVAVALLGTVLLPLLAKGGPAAGRALLWPTLFVWGGTAFGIYTVGLSLLAERFPRAELAAANTAFVMAYETGSLSGPVTAGGAMDALGPHGLVITVAVVCALFLLASLRRRSPG